MAGTPRRRRKWPSSTSGRHAQMAASTKSLNQCTSTAWMRHESHRIATCRTTVSDDQRREILRTIVSGLRNDERGGSFCALPRSSQRDCVHPSVDDFFCHTSLQGRSAYPGRLLRHGYVIRRPLLPQDDAGSRAGGQRPTHCLGGALLSCDAPSRGLVICVTRSVTADIPTGT